MPYRYLVSMAREALGNDDPPFPGWSAFLRARTKGKAQFCKGLMGDRPSDDAPKVGAEGAGVDDPEAPDFPWVTLVLGAECLEVPSLGKNKATEFQDAVHKQFGGVVAYGPALRAAEGFVSALVRDRLPEVWPSGGSNETDDPDAEAATGPVLAEWEIRLLAAAATVNVAYFLAKSEQRLAASRWNDDTVRLLRTRSSTSDGSVPSPELVSKVETAKQVLGDLVEVLDGLHDPDAPVADQRPLSLLIRRVMDDLNRKEAHVSAADLQALTEVAWHCMISKTDTYPAWPDLMLGMSLDQGARVMRQGHPRPSYIDPDNAERVVNELLRKPTEVTASRYDRDDAETPRDAMYASYARVLLAQAEFRASTLKRYKGARQRALVPPPATALVTTFDVELEMALRRRARAGSFVVALPVNLIDTLEGGRSRATSMWLGYVVRKSDKAVLRAVTDPNPEDWFLLSSIPAGDLDRSPRSRSAGRLNRPTPMGAFAGSPPGGRASVPRELLPEGVALGALPFVIRLAGSPLVTLPEINVDDESPLAMLRDRALELAFLEQLDDQSADGEVDAPAASADMRTRLRRDRMHFSHATVLEEHHSLRLSLPEVVTEHRRGLPSSLTGGARGGFWRSWMLLGVQVSDPVIRYRLLAQLIGAGLAQRGAARYRRPAHSGTVVNSGRLSADATDVLKWSEFEIVRDRCDAMTPDLEHYVMHLTRGGPTGSWPVASTEKCPL